MLDENLIKLKWSRTLFSGPRELAVNLDIPDKDTVAIVIVVNQFFLRKDDRRNFGYFITRAMKSVVKNLFSCLSSF